MSEAFAVDISQYQGATDYPQLAAQIHGAICRASIGIQDDLLFDTHWAGLTAQGRPVGAYHYLIDDINGVWQAETFLTQLEGRTPQVWNGAAWVPGYVLDVEDNSAGLSPSALAARIKAFILTVKAARPELAAVIYTRGYFWNDNVGLSELAFFATLLLWIARYTSLSAPWGNAGDQAKLRPAPWFDWVLWQFSADGNNQGDEFGVSSDDIDLDRLKNAPPLPPVIPPPPGGDKLGKCVAVVTFRAYPVVADCTKQRMTIIGEPFVILGERTICGHSWWNVEDQGGVKGWCVKSGVVVL